MAKKPFDKERLDELNSALQKSVRRGLEYQALHFASEMEDIQRGTSWVWNTLKTIASEDIGLAQPSMPILIDALARNYDKMKANKHKKYRIFLAHAILQLCRSPKSRVVDEYVAVVYGDKKSGKTLSIPNWMYDHHTEKGARMGRGITYFLRVSSRLNKEKVTRELRKWRNRAYKLWIKYKGKI